METIQLNSIEFKAGNWPLANDKPVIIFFHGASLSKEFWDIHVDGLKDCANTIAVDLPGHGGTELPSKETIKDFSTDIIAFIKAIDVKTPVVVCGMSMGGAVAQQLLIDSPNSFKAGILINTGARLKVLPMIFDMVNADYEGYIDNTAQFSISGKSDLKKIQELAKSFTGNCNAETTINDFNACNSFDIMDRISEIKCPILVIAATEDMSTPLKYGKWLHENIKGSEFVEIQDAGHFSPLEKPEEIGGAIREFIGKLCDRQVALIRE